MNILQPFRKLKKKLHLRHIQKKYAFLYNVHSTAQCNILKIHPKANCQLTVKEDSLVQGFLYFEQQNASINIGARTFLGGSSLLCANSLTVGDDVLISFGCVIADHHSHSIYFDLRKNDVLAWAKGEKDWTNVTIKPVIIQDKAWIGMHAIILAGVTIGEGAVVGAGSIVTKDVPPYTLVAGNPARFIRSLRDNI